MRIRLSVLFALCCLSDALSAQTLEPIALTHQRRARSVVTFDTVPRTDTRGVAAQRYLVSTVGAAVGAVAGVWIAFEVGTQGCDGPRGFCGIGADYGTAWMTAMLIPGAALGAAIPGGSSTCSFRERLVTSTGGALIGGGLGALVGSSQSRGTMAWLAFAGSTVGATYSAHRCRKE